MKENYDKKAITRKFDVEDEVTVLITQNGGPLKAKYHGPYSVVR